MQLYEISRKISFGGFPFVLLTGVFVNAILAAVKWLTRFYRWFLRLLAVTRFRNISG
jgi:hypothetical protein